MNKNTIWLSSYPKSGRTWLKILLESVLLHEGNAVDINRLQFTSTTKINKKDFDARFGISSSDLLFEELLPLKRCYLKEAGEMRKYKQFVVTHNANIKFNNQHLFPEEISRSAIQLTRNPLSVVTSMAHHLKISKDESIELMNLPDISYGRERLYSSPNVDSRMGSWTSHISSWMNCKDYPVHVMKYEDLLVRPEEMLKKVLEFTGDFVSDEVIEKAVYHGSFDKLHRMEKVNGFRERPSTSAGFFRKGKTDSWKEELNTAQIDRVVKDHQEMMEKLGYTL